MKQNLEKLWDEVKVLTEPQAVALSLEPKQGPGEPLLAKLNIFTKPSELRVVFLHEHNAENSAWVRAHDKGIEALQQAFPDRVFITRKENIEPEVDAEQVLEDVAHDNADVVFTSSARMHTACLKVAAQHPKTRILNCSLNAPHPRTYEVTYLLGMLAGVMARTDRVGYVAANPVYGIPAAVNAFAQGLKTVRPEAKVVLRWACLQDPAHPLDLWRSSMPGITASRKAPTGITALCAACRTAVCSRWACPCGGGIRFISRSCVPFLTVHGTAMLPVPGR